MNRTSLVLLAGGQGSRLGGADKGLLRCHGRTLVEQLLADFAPQVDECLIIANRHLEQYRQLALPFAASVHRDLERGFHGPLLGMLTGLVYARTEQVLVLPCDAWRLPVALLPKLRAQQQATMTRATFACVQGRDVPVCCLLERDLLAELEQAFCAGERSPLRWLAKVGASRCELGEQAAATRWSINTPSDLAAANCAPVGEYVSADTWVSGLAPTGDLLFLAQEK